MTELISDGKHKDGKKQGSVRIALPFQTIETVSKARKTGCETLSSLRTDETFDLET